jgi:hypothetical protein
MARSCTNGEHQDLSQWVIDKIAAGVESHASIAAFQFWVLNIFFADSAESRPG